MSYTLIASICIINNTTKTGTVTIYNWSKGENKVIVYKVNWTSYTVLNSKVDHSRLLVLSLWILQPRPIYNIPKYKNAFLVKVKWNDIYTLYLGVVRTFEAIPQGSSRRLSYRRQLEINKPMKSLLRNEIKVKSKEK
jgi:hypothetical protein